MAIANIVERLLRAVLAIGTNCPLSQERVADELNPIAMTPWRYTFRDARTSKNEVINAESLRPHTVSPIWIEWGKPSIIGDRPRARFGR